jgi:hypothetical protein
VTAHRLNLSRTIGSKELTFRVSKLAARVRDALFWKTLKETGTNRAAQSQ